MTIGQGRKTATSSRTALITARASRSKMHQQLLAAIVVYVTCLTCTESVAMATTEYCQWEMFNVTCPTSHVMLITEARYGRMRLGRCLATDIFVGCSADVTDEVNKRCGGRSGCIVDLPDSTLHAMQPCPRDMMAYMELSYECIAVTTMERNTPCLSGRSLPVTTSSGYMSPNLATTSGWGSRDCPWSIKVKAGQRLKLSVLDLKSTIAGRWRAAEEVAEESGGGSSRGWGPQGTSRCLSYVVVSEITGQKQQQQWLYCAGADTGDRKPSLVTLGERVEIAINVANMAADKNINFLLHYEAVGCEDLQVPAGAHAERRGETVTVTCNATGQVWHLVCKDTTWVGSVSNNCTLEAQQPLRNDQLDASMPTYGLILAVIVGVIVGMTCGSITLMSILWAKRRRHKRGVPAHGVTSANMDQFDVMLPPDGCCAEDRDELSSQRIYTGTGGAPLSTDTGYRGSGDLFQVVDPRGVPYALYRKDDSTGGKCPCGSRTPPPYHRQQTLLVCRGGTPTQVQRKTQTFPAGIIGREWAAAKGGFHTSPTPVAEILPTSRISNSISSDKLLLLNSPSATTTPSPQHLNNMASSTPGTNRRQQLLQQQPRYQQPINLSQHRPPLPAKQQQLNTLQSPTALCTDGLDLIDCTTNGNNSSSNSSNGPAPLLLSTFKKTPLTAAEDKPSPAMPVT